MPAKAVPRKAEKPVERKPYDFGFTLGADPEYTVIAGNRPMHAMEILQTFFGKDMTSRNDGYEIEGGNFGWDGHKQTGELRPSPAKTPAALVANLKAMFTEAHKRMPFIDLTTLTIAGPTGGHIHLAIPEDRTDILNSSTKMQAYQRGLSSFLLLIMFGENSLSREMRKRGGNYGQITDFRVDPKFTWPSGNPGYTMEVRGATAEWISTEKIALGTIAFMAIAWDSLLRGKCEPIAEIIFKSTNQAKESIEPILANFASLQNLYLNKMRPFIRNHPAYPDYKDALELIMNPERVLEAKKAAHYSIYEGWGLGTSSKDLTASAMFKDDEIEDKTSRFPEQIIRNLSQFSWNDDINVQAFATAMGKRCMAFGWKPAHEYFLFGLKKGMDALILRDEAGRFFSGQEIVSTRQDYDVVNHKFDRLAPKAAPAYGKFIDPRSGMLTDNGELRRVMIGIPYTMRQKMDLRPLIRLVLKYEKNPKSLPLLVRDSLPEGESKIQRAVESEEQTEAQIDHALANGDKPREVHEETVERLQEERSHSGLVGGEAQPAFTASSSTLAFARRGFELMQAITAPGLAESFTLQLVSGQITQQFVDIRDTSTRAEVAAGLATLIRNVTAGVDLNEALMASRSSKVVTYLALVGLGQRGSASLGEAGWSHRVRFVSPGTFQLSTNSITTNSINLSTAVLIDLLGLRADEQSRVINVIEANHGVTFTISKRSTFVQSGANINIVTDDSKPHVWNHN